jgi:hypothetical protein
MPLVIEAIAPNQVAVAHYREQNGDLIADPEIVFWVNPDNGEWFPVEVTQVPVAIRVNGETRVGGGWKRYVEIATDGSLAEIKNARMQADLCSFTNLWAKNIKAQGWLKNSVQVKQTSHAEALDILASQPRLPDSHLRAPLPDDLRARSRDVHRLALDQDTYGKEYPFYADDVLRIVGTHLVTGKWSWCVLYAVDADHNDPVMLWNESPNGGEIIGGETAQAAAQALQDHLHAWGVQAQVTLDVNPARIARQEKPKLPPDIPETIEVDAGGNAGWKVVRTVRVSGKWLYYGNGDKKAKVPLAGRGMVWRPAAA